MAKITVSKEKECNLLWRFIAPESENVASLASVLAKTRETIDEHYKELRRADGDDEPDWKELSMMLLGTVDGFMDFVKDYCLAYTNMIKELRETLTAVKTNEEGE